MICLSLSIYERSLQNKMRIHVANIRILCRRMSSWSFVNAYRSLHLPPELLFESKSHRELLLFSFPFRINELKYQQFTFFCCGCRI